MTEVPLSGEKLELGDNSVGWLPCHIGIGTDIGSNCSIGALAHIGRDVIIGDGCRLQGGCYIADKTLLGRGVFIGPNATILNDRHPPSGGRWSPVEVAAGAVIGGGATIVAGVSIGENSVVAVGTTVTCDIPPGEVWAGVPATYLMSRDEYESRREQNG